MKRTPVTELLTARWPLFEILYKLQMTKKRNDDLEIAPKDLQLNLDSPTQDPVDVPEERRADTFS